MIFDILIFLVVLSILIIVHELGHFIMARRAGILVEEFGFGLPPRIWGKKIGETLYSINLLPFGGFVKLHGESSQETITKPKRAFFARGKKTRVSVIVAGVIMNFLLAIVAFSVVYSFSGIPRQTERVKVVDVSAESPAQIAGLLVGDVITKVGDETIESTREFIEITDENAGKRMVVEIRRETEGEEPSKKITVTPRESPPEGEGPLGVTISATEVYYPPFYLRPFYGIYYGFGEAFFWGKTVVVGLFNIFSDLFAGEAPKDLSGPVGIFAVTSEAAAVGALALINFVGILSVNLAILNILPFPALDGGRLLFIVIETIAGKRVAPRIEGIIHTIGMLILLLLIFAITAKDIKLLIQTGSLTGFLDSFR